MFFFFISTISDAAKQKIQQMLFFDVNNGIARRSWARNEGAIISLRRVMNQTPNLKVTLPNLVADDLINSLQQKTQ